VEGGAYRDTSITSNHWFTFSAGGRRKNSMGGGLTGRERQERLARHSTQDIGTRPCSRGKGTRSLKQEVNRRVRLSRFSVNRSDTSSYQRIKRKQRGGGEPGLCQRTGDAWVMLFPLPMQFWGGKERTKIAGGGAATSKKGGGGPVLQRSITRSM